MDTHALDYTLRIRDLPASERPRERLRDAGPNALSVAELLAILLRTGTPSESALALGSRLLAQFGGLAGLARASLREMCATHGVGEAKAAQLMAGFELGKRLLALHPEERAVVRSPADAANLLQAEMGLLAQEHLRVLLLNTKNRVLGVSEVYKGNVNSSMVRPGEVFRDAVRENCPAIIVAHNHPSGDPTPSQEDVQMTRRLVEAGKLLDIEVLDHLVIAGNSFVSLREKKQGFE
ncbi:MAG: DNA repair protein RadC [Chloroflexota bacterium]